MNLLNQEQDRNWTVTLIIFFVTGAIWAAWNRDAFSIAGCVGLALGLGLFYQARHSKHSRLLRWIALSFFASSFLLGPLRNFVLVLLGARA